MAKQKLDTSVPVLDPSRTESKGRWRAPSLSISFLLRTRKRYGPTQWTFQKKSSAGGLLL